MAIPGTTYTARRRLWAAGLLCAGLAGSGGAWAPTWAAPPVVAAPDNLGAGVQVDWNRGVLVAAGSCAADLFAASAEIARVKAERVARNRAEARLRRALQTLGREPRLRGKIAPETLAQLDPAQAKVVHIEYASTGSVALRLELLLTAKASAPAPTKSPTTPTADEAKDGGPAAASEGENSP